MELFIYQGQYQLATTDALYSDGTRYKPIRIACKYLKDKMSDIKSVLMLGTGLGSGVQILAEYGCNAKYTLVEYDRTVLDWAMELMPGDLAKRITPVCIDAQQFMNENTQKFDLIIVDIFRSRIVPDFVTSRTFLEQCKHAINPNGYWVLNYIEQLNESWDSKSIAIHNVFPTSSQVDHDINKIVIAKV
ncbi:MAG: methyltransferase domain-containing protein [Chitinophagales bacterium]|nr:methyltransferase domain-containing protein [Chitinophagaceae bacterium]MCB9065947.1 methyltransferase domain-containing protein [Chitinophagales bacterium]